MGGTREALCSRVCAVYGGRMEYGDWEEVTKLGGGRERRRERPAARVNIHEEPEVRQGAGDSTSQCTGR